MKVLLIHFGNYWECLASTALLKHYVNDDVDILVEDKKKAIIFRGHKFINKIYLCDRLPSNFEDNCYDLVVNLHYNFNENIIGINSARKIGFNYSDNSFDYYKILYGDKKSKKNIFQVYYNLAHEKWKGQHPFVAYYPKNKSNKKKTGILIDNRVLKNYMLDKLKLENSKLWYIPHRRNFHKQLDEINRCKMVVTDNFFSLLMAMCLQKNVYFLQRIKYNFRIDLLGMGNAFEVPRDMLL